MEEENSKRFTLLVVPSNKKRVMEFSMSYTMVALIPVLVGLFIIIWAVTSGRLTSENASLKEQIVTATADKEKAQSESILLQAHIEELDQTIADAQLELNKRNDEVAKNSEEQTKRYIPDSFPVAGAVGVPSEYTDENPYRQFTMGDGTRVIATADGTVKSITSENETNVIEVDHGNGYISKYTCKGILTVNVGDSVLRQTTLLLGTNKTLDDNENAENGQAGIVLTYEVEFNGVSIDPMTMIEVNG